MYRWTWRHKMTEYINIAEVNLFSLLFFYFCCLFSSVILISSFQTVFFSNYDSILHLTVWIESWSTVLARSRSHLFYSVIPKASSKFYPYVIRTACFLSFSHFYHKRVVLVLIEWQFRYIKSKYQVKQSVFRKWIRYLER